MCRDCDRSSLSVDVYLLLVDMSQLVAIGYWYLLNSYRLSYVFSYTFMICLSGKVLERMLSCSEVVGRVLFIGSCPLCMLSWKDVSTTFFQRYTAANTLEKRCDIFVLSYAFSYS